MNEALRALAEPNRLAIVAQLAEGECAAGDLAHALPIGQPTVSKHLSVLRRAGLVQVRRDANRRLYRLNPAPLAEIDAWLARYRHFWNDRLDALERHLDAKHPKHSKHSKYPKR